MAMLSHTASVVKVPGASPGHLDITGQCSEAAEKLAQGREGLRIFRCAQHITEID